MLGIILGAYTCNYLYVSRMNWIYIKNKKQMIKPCKDKLSSLIEKFKPNVWQKHDWAVFANLYNYLAVIFYCIFVLSVDCNNFFLKFILWILLIMTSSKLDSLSGLFQLLQLRRNITSTFKISTVTEWDLLYGLLLLHCLLSSQYHLNLEAQCFMNLSHGMCNLCGLVLVLFY